MDTFLAIFIGSFCGTFIARIIFDVFERKNDK